MAETRLVHVRGRPVGSSKAERLLTPEILEQVAALLLEGHHKETVSDFLGIRRSTWWNWEQRGEREPDSVFGLFLDVTRKSMAGAEIGMVRDIRLGVKGWESRAWMAERRFPQRWGKRVEITLRQEAERLAAEFGKTVEEVLRDAEEAAAGVSDG